MNDEFEKPGIEDVAREADGRLIHGLLLHLHDDRGSEHREQRVLQAMQAIRSPHGETPLQFVPKIPLRNVRSRPWIRRTVWAAAALLLIAVGLFTLTDSSSTAYASLNDILGALARPGDRAFKIQVEPSTPEPQSRAGLDGATLYLRDGRQYLLERNDPKGGSLFDGYDGRQSWRIRAGVIVETREGLGAGGLAMPQSMSETLFTEIQPTLERIGVDYTVEALDQVPLPPGGKAQRHVFARRKSHDVKGPESIEIWADPTTGMPRRIVFDQVKFQGSAQPRRLTLDLVGEAPLAPDWFAPGAHTTEGLNPTRPRSR